MLRITLRAGNGNGLSILSGNEEMPIDPKDAVVFDLPTVNFNMAPVSDQVQELTKDLPEELRELATGGAYVAIRRAFLIDALDRSMKVEHI